MSASSSTITKVANPNVCNTLISLLNQKNFTNNPLISLVDLKKLHSLLIVFGHPQTSHTHTKILFHSLPSISSSIPGAVFYVSSLLTRIHNPSITLWNSIIQAFSVSSEPKLSIVFFAKMRKNGVIPNKHTFPVLLKAVSRAGNEDPFKVYGQIVKLGLSYDQFVQNSLVSAIANCGYVVYARQVYDEITDRNVISMTAMIDGYLRNECATEGLGLFAEMRLAGVPVDERTVVSVLRAVGILGEVWNGKWVHGFYVVSGRICCDVYVGSALVDMYSKCGYCDDARKAFEDMHYKNVVSWTALISGCVHCNRFEDTLDLFKNMLSEKVKPNKSTLTSVLTACAQVGALYEGKWIHKYIDMKKFIADPTIGTSLIDMYTKCGCIHEAYMVFESMHVKDVYIWTAMINGLAWHGDAANSLRLFSQMLSNEVRPNRVTLTGVLNACSHGGFVDEGRKIFESMNEVFGLEPSLDHYGCMVDLLGRAGCLDEALELIKNMPMDPSPAVWGALFGACMIHKSYELGEKIGKHLIKLQPHHSGRYALLFNVYAACENWKAAAQLRKHMKDKSVDKSAGSSWVEINGVIQQFIAFDTAHTDATSVYETLDRILVQMECAGCPMDTDILTTDLP